MDLGIGIGGDLRLDEDARRDLVVQAHRLGYSSAWANAPGVGVEALATCRRWLEATHITTGVNVVPTPGLDLEALAAAARELGAASDGRFILGIGAGPLSDPAWRAKNGLADARPLATMREHLITLRATGVPVYLAAMGPEMLRVAGEHADGVLPNYMDPAQIAWARERIAEGARGVNRDPSAIRVVQYIRVCVDEDVDLARHALARHVLGYALGRRNVRGGGHYRALMTRMGLDTELTALEKKRDAGAGDDDLADACPDAVLGRLGAWGTPAGALAAARVLAGGLDLPIIRIVRARPTIESALAVIEACAPTHWR